MKKSTIIMVLVSLLMSHRALASPFSVIKGIQDVFDGVQGYPELASDIAVGLHQGPPDIDNQQVAKLLGVEQANIEFIPETDFWFIKIKTDNTATRYKLLSSPSNPKYMIRLIEHEAKKGLCDTKVKHYTGYVDFMDEKGSYGKHLFFWLAESRTNPETAPLILSLGGGPGGTSSANLLGGYGPCRIREDNPPIPGKDNEHPQLNLWLNKFSLNSFANNLFLDQPVNVGYSYSDPALRVRNSHEAALDVYQFLQAFFKYRPGGRDYSALDFHIEGGSYAGTYIPHIASVIHEKNINPDPKDLKISLKSIMLANGWTDPLTQSERFGDVVCGDKVLSTGPKLELRKKACKDLFKDRGLLSSCLTGLKACYDAAADKKQSVCPGANTACNALQGPFEDEQNDLGFEMDDVDLDCSLDKNEAVCKNGDWIETWMNKKSVNLALGIGQRLIYRYKLVSEQVHDDFVASGDGAHNSAPLLATALDNGVRVLVFAGVNDAICNYKGNEAWMDKLKPEFKGKKLQDWKFDGETVGQFKKLERVAGAGYFTFVSVENAGHNPVPREKPEIALALIKSWVYNQPLPSTLE